MEQFNKFLDTGEDLVMVATLQTRKYLVLLVYLLIIALFFLLYPSLQWGRQSFFLWLALLLMLTILLARRLAAIHDSCLLTNRRLIFLQAVSKDYFRRRAYLWLKDIEKVVRHDRYDLYIVTAKRRLHLRLTERDEVYHQIQKTLQLP